MNKRVIHRVLSAVLSAAMLSACVLPAYAAGVPEQQPTDLALLAAGAEEYTYDTIANGPDSVMYKTVAASSQQNNELGKLDGPAKQAFDGNREMDWHTQYDQTPPHTIEWDLPRNPNGTPILVSGLEYQMRTHQNNGQQELYQYNGKWMNVTIQATADDGTVKTVFNGATGLDENTGIAKMTFQPAEAKHMKVTINTTKGNGTEGVCCAGELILTKATPKAPPMPETAVVAEVQTQDGKVQTYETLHAAFDAAVDGSTIRLHKNVTFGTSKEPMSTLETNYRNLTLDLAGFTISGGDRLDDRSPVLKIRGTFVLTDSSKAKTGTIIGWETDDMPDVIYPQYTAIEIEKPVAEVTIQGGTVIGMQSRNSLHGCSITAIENHAVVNVTGGTIIGTRSVGTTTSGLGTAFFNGAYGTLNAAAGTFIGAAAANLEYDDQSSGIKTTSDTTTTIEGEALICGVKADTVHKGIEGDILNDTCGIHCGGGALNINSGARVLAVDSPSIEPGSCSAAGLYVNSGWKTDININGGYLEGAGELGGAILDLKAARVTIQNGPNGDGDWNVAPVLVNRSGSAVRAEKVNDNLNICGGIFESSAAQDLVIEPMAAETVVGGIFSHDFAAGANDPALLGAGLGVQKGTLTDGAWTDSASGSQYRVGEPQPAKHVAVSMTEGESQQLIVSGALESNSAPDVVEAVVAEYQQAAQGHTGTDKTFSGPAEALTDALYTFKGGRDGQHFYISANTADGQQIWLAMNGYPDASRPFQKKAREVQLRTYGGKVYFKDTVENRWLCLMESAAKYGASTRVQWNDKEYQFDLYRLAKADEPSSEQLPGFVKLTGENEIQDGGRYLIAHAMADGSVMVMRPSAEANNQAHMLKADASLPLLPASGLTLTAKTAGNAAVQVGNTIYDVTVAPRPVQEHLDSFNVNLGAGGGDIAMNFYYTFADSFARDESARVVLTWPGETPDRPNTKTVYLNQIRNDPHNANGHNPNQKGQFWFTVELPARQMADKVQVQAMTDSYAGVEHQLSVRDYAELLLRDQNASAEMKELLRTMLYYGSCAQQYKRYNLNDLAETGIEAAELARIQKEAAALTAESLDAFAPKQTGKLPEGIQLMGTNLSMTSRTVLRFAFKLDAGKTDADFHIYGSHIAGIGEDFRRHLTQVGEYACVEHGNILPQHLDAMHALEFRSEQGDVLYRMEYGPMSYVRTVLMNQQRFAPEVVESMRALRLYNLAANAYLASIN